MITTVRFYFKPLNVSPAEAILGYPNLAGWSLIDADWNPALSYEVETRDNEVGISLMASEKILAEARASAKLLGLQKILDLNHGLLCRLNSGETLSVEGT